MTARKKATAAAEPIPAEPVKPTHQPGLKIFAMQVENIKKVSFARIRPHSDVVIVSGANGSGKTSILDAIEWGITGTSHVPSQPIRKGERTARIQIDLGDFKLTRHFTRVDPEKSAKGEHYITKLILEGKNRETYKSPQALLDSFMGQISFDPLEFIRMDDRQQLEALRKLVVLDVNLDDLEAEKKTAYESRRDAGRDLDSANARLRSMQAPPEDLPEAAIDTDELTKKLEGAANHNSIRAAKLQEHARKLEQAQDRIARALAIEQEIARLEQLIKNLRLEHEAVDQQHKELVTEAMEMVIPEPIDTAEIAKALQEAQTTNGAIARREVYLSVKAQVVEAQKRWEAFDATVKAKDQERAAAIARAKMPIPGLGIGDGEVTFNELPFSQASNAEQIAASTALAMASNPKLRVLRIKDGSLLDDKSLAVIAKMATDAEYQVWIERVNTNGAVGVVMEDGEASGDATEKPTEPAKK